MAIHIDYQKYRTEYHLARIFPLLIQIAINYRCYPMLGAPSQELLGPNGLFLHQRITYLFLLLAIYANPY